MSNDLVLKEDDLKGQNEQHLEKALEIVAAIKDDESYQTAYDIGGKINDQIKKVSEYWKIPIESAFATHKNLTQKRKEMLDPLETIVKRIKAGCAFYQDVKAANLRIEQEKQIAEQTKQADDAKIAAALEASNSGNDALAAAIIEQPTAVVAITPPKAKGNDKEWVYEVTDLKAFIQHAAKDDTAIGALQINESALKNLIKLKQSEKPYPGISARLVSKTVFRK